MWGGTYESWVRSAAWRFSLCVSLSIRSEPWSAVRELWGGGTHRQLGVTFGGPYPYKIHAAIQPLKCYFFREILPQFIPTNGSLHTSKSHGCLNGCTAHVYTLVDRHTQARRTQTNTQRAVPREKGSAASSGLVNHLLFSSNETNNKVQMEPA